MLFDNVMIESLGHEVGPHIVSSLTLEEQISDTMQRLEIPPNYLEKMTGIRERRFFDAGTQPSEIATRAGEKVIEQAGIDRDRIGSVISTSVTRDYAEPSTASLVHGNLGLSANCINFDIANACLGFVNGIAQTAMLIEKGVIEYGLVVAGECVRHPVEATLDRLQAATATKDDFRDQFATLTLGDGAVAMLLTNRDLASGGAHRVNGGVNMSATEFNRLCVGALDHSQMVTKANMVLREGIALAGRTWHLAARTLHDWSDGAIDLYAPHQVSLRQIAGMAKVMGVNPDKIHLTVQELGNNAAAAIAIALSVADEQGRMERGDHVAMLGVGSGLNCSMMSVTW